MNVSPAEETAAAPRPQHQRGERLPVRAGAMVHGGVCLAQLPDGTALLLDGAIPGELVTAELHHRKGRVWFARAVGIVEPAEHRIAAPCPYYGTCGGCQLQHVAYGYQLALKRGIVEDAMRRQGVRLPQSPAVHPMDDPWRYRWRGEFHVVPGDAGIRDADLGFNRLRSWTPVAVEDCLIHHPRITATLPALRELVRTADGTLTALHLTAGEDGAELLLRPRPSAALHAQAIDAAALATRDRWSTTSTTLRWRDHIFRVSPESFIQVNWAQVDVLYRLAIAGLAPLQGTPVVDAYAGIGVLACELAARGFLVTCIENNRHAAQLGVHNAELNGRSASVRYIAEPVEDVIAVAAAGASAVLLDPPRAGCDARVTAWLALAGPPRVVYVSCDPATLARDLRLLTSSGPYVLDSLDIVDMFPQTHHVECVAVLTRTPAPAPAGRHRRRRRAPVPRDGDGARS